MTTKKITLSAECRALFVLKRKESATKKKYDEAKAAREIAERHLLQRMEAEGAEGHKAGGVNYVPTKTEYAQVQDAEAFTAWVRVHQPELLEEKPRKGLVNELVRQLLDDNEPFPPGLGFYVKEYVSKRAA
jgi:hypothetical protein